MQRLKCGDLQLEPDDLFRNDTLESVPRVHNQWRDPNQRFIVKSRMVRDDNHAVGFTSRRRTN